MHPTGTAVLNAQPVLNGKGYCLNPKSKKHSINLRLGSSSGGVTLESIVLRSLRIGGGLLSSVPSHLKQNDSE